MIERIKGKYYLHCDICGEGTNEAYDTWDEAKAALRVHGYETNRFQAVTETIWQNICPDCQE